MSASTCSVSSRLGPPPAAAAAGWGRLLANAKWRRLPQSEPPDDVAAEVPGDVAHVDGAAAQCADEVVGLGQPCGTEAALGGRREDIGGEHAPHLPPLVPGRGNAGAAVADAAERGGGERGGAVREDGVVAAQHLAGHGGARHDTATTWTGPRRTHTMPPPPPPPGPAGLGQQAVQPPGDWPPACWPRHLVMLPSTGSPRGPGGGKPPLDVVVSRHHLVAP